MSKALTVAQNARKLGGAWDESLLPSKAGRHPSPVFLLSPSTRLKDLSLARASANCHHGTECPGEPSAVNCLECCCSQESLR